MGILSLHLTKTQVTKTARLEKRARRGGLTARDLKRHPPNSEGRWRLTLTPHWDSTLIHWPLPSSRSGVRDWARVGLPRSFPRARGRTDPWLAQAQRRRVRPPPHPTAGVSRSRYLEGLKSHKTRLAVLILDDEERAPIFIES